MSWPVTCDLHFSPAGLYFMKCLINEQQCFILARDFTPAKTRATSLLNITSRTILEKRVSMELITMTLLWTLEISIWKKTLRMKLLSKTIKSQTCLEIFQSMNNISQRGHGVLFQSFFGSLKMPRKRGS